MVANEKDLVPVICRLSAGSIEDVLEIDAESNRPPWTRAVFLGEFAAQHSVVYGARLHGGLIGYLVCHVVVDEAHVVNFGVRAGWRGRGIGRETISYVIEDLREMGVRAVTLEVRRSNRVAVLLYESLGFVEVGVREKYYTDNQEDAILMRLDCSGR